MNKVRIQSLENSRRLLQQLSDINTRLNELKQSPQIREYFSLLKKQREVEAEYKSSIKSPCRHDMVIFMGYQKKDNVSGPIECSDPILEEAVYSCVDCGEKKVLPVTARYDEIVNFEAIRDVIGHRYTITQEDLERMIGYYRDSIVTYGVSQAREALKENYPSLITKKPRL